MNDSEILKRISLDPEVLSGKPVIRGTRLSVEFVIGLLAHGATVPDLLAEYEGLEPEDIQACLLFAGESLRRVEFIPLSLETV
jgi:uncharacterized protein (DUF433 family)